MHLGPKLTGQVSELALDYPPFKAMVASEVIELLDESPGTGGSMALGLKRPSGPRKRGGGSGARRSGER